MDELADLDRARLMLARHNLGRAVGAASVVSDALTRTVDLMDQASPYPYCSVCGVVLVPPKQSEQGVRVGLRILTICTPCWGIGVELWEPQR